MPTLTRAPVTPDPLPATIEQHPLVAPRYREWQAQQSRLQDLEAERQRIELDLYAASRSDTVPAHSPRRLQRKLEEVRDAIEEIGFDLRATREEFAHAQTRARKELFPALASVALPLLAQLNDALQGVCTAQEALHTLADRCRTLGVDLPLVSAFDGGSTAQRRVAVQQAVETLQRVDGLRP